MKNKLNITTSTVKEFNDEERSIIAYGSVPVKDRDSELILHNAWDLKAFKDNPVLMLSHDYSRPPVGKVRWIKAEKEGLKFKATFSKTAIGDELYQLYKDDIMKGFSVGFIPKAWEDKESKDSWRPELRTFTEVELLEISCVSIPCCPKALVEEVKSGTSSIKTKAISEAILNLEEKKEEKKEVKKEKEEHIIDKKDVKDADADVDDVICYLCGKEVPIDAKHDDVCDVCLPEFEKKMEAGELKECKDCGDIFEPTYEVIDVCNDCLIEKGMQTILAEIKAEEQIENDKLKALEQTVMDMATQIAELTAKQELSEEKKESSVNVNVSIEKAAADLTEIVKQLTPLVKKKVEESKDINFNDDIFVIEEKKEVKEKKKEEVEIDFDIDDLKSIITDALKERPSISDTVDEKLRKLQGKME